MARAVSESIAFLMKKSDCDCESLESLGRI